MLCSLGGLFYMVSAHARLEVQLSSFFLWAGSMTKRPAVGGVGTPEREQTSLCNNFDTADLHVDHYCDSSLHAQLVYTGPHRNHRHNMRQLEPELSLKAYLPSGTRCNMQM